MPIWTRVLVPGSRVKGNDIVMMVCSYPSSRAPLVAAFRFFAWAVIALLAFACLAAQAQTLAQPKWSELSRERQQALQPLAGQWDTLDNTRRKKWIVVADRYPAMQPEEQKRMQSRMADWARLTPEQRRVARENYKKSKSLPSEQKIAGWQQYQTLPDAQKQQLAATAEQNKPARQKAQQREREGTVKPMPPAKQPVGKPAARAEPIAPKADAPAAPIGK